MSTKRTGFAPHFLAAFDQNGALTPAQAKYYLPPHADDLELIDPEGDGGDTEGVTSEATPEAEGSQSRQRRKPGTSVNAD